jgi:uncharacterized protein
MPEYLAPGVYVEEVDRGPVPIEGVSTSTAGFVGVTARGPSTGRPQLVTNFREFERRFGAHFATPAGWADGNNLLPFAVEGFFANGGQRVYIKRVIGQGAGRSFGQSRGGMVTRLTEDATGTTLKPATLRGMVPNRTSVTLRMVRDGVTTTSGPHAVNGVNAATGEIQLGSALTGTFDRRFTTVTTNVIGLTTTGLVDTTAGNRPNSIMFRARDEGGWGDGLVVEVAPEPVPAGRAQFVAVAASTANDTTITMRSTAGFYQGAWLELDTGVDKIYRPLLEVAGLNLRVAGTFPAAGPALTATTVVSTCEFRVTATFGAATEQFTGLTLVNVPGRYYAQRINTLSSLLTVDEINVPPSSPTAPAGNTNPFFFPSGDDGTRVLLGGGTDGAAQPTALQYQGTDLGPGNRTGIRALEDIDEISIIAAPGVTSLVVQQALINQCEDLKDRFAVLDPAPRAGNAAPRLDDIRNQRNNFDTRYAALYYPRVLVDDPTTDDPAPVPVPPSGHIVGIYARTDTTRGVHKAPANEVIRGIEDYETLITKREQDILNPLNINVLRDFRADRRGLRVWGARVLTSDAAWRYVPVRRLFIFLEESLDEGTQFVVFEPNDEQLWARVIQTVAIFLTRVWRDGALMGTTPEEAFFVRCDRTTMSDDDILNGRLIMEVGVAPVRPAEFVVIRISQKTLTPEA